MSGEFKRDQSGRFSDNVTVQDILKVFDQLYQEEPLTTREVADELPIGRRATHERLEIMHGGGKLGKKDMGNRVVWWANVAPEPSDEVRDAVVESEERDEFVPLNDD